MRRNRRGPGWSGSTTFIARALATTEADLVAALAALNLVAAENPDAKPVFTEIGAHVYWLNRDGRGGIWINGEEKRNGQKPEAGDQMSEGRGPTAEANAAPSAPIQNSSPSPFAAVRLLLKPNKRGSGVSGEVGYLARTMGKSPEELLNALLAAGLTLPAGGDAKPTFVEHGGEIFWFNENASDESLWLNAKAAKKFPARKPAAGRGRSAKKSAT